MKNKNILYVFFHINKTAGTTFAYHIENHFRRKQIIRASIQEPFYNIITGKLDSYDYDRRKLEAYLLSLSPAQKDNIMMILGHHANITMEKYFGRPTRYFTFIRHPRSLLASHYNFDKWLWLNNKHPGSRMDNLVPDGKFPDFDSYLWRIGDNFITRFICRQFLLEDIGGAAVDRTHLEKAKKTLKSFYFVGITENFEKDAAILYDELGISKFFGNKNVTQDFLSPLSLTYYVPEYMEHIIHTRNKYDYELYEYACELNRSFKKRRKYIEIRDSYLRGWRYLSKVAAEPMRLLR